MWTKLFLNHPRAVEESYGEHAIFAGRFAAQLFFAAVCALILALIPGVFEKTASKIVARLYAQTAGRGV
jgi:TctA family transporter